MKALIFCGGKGTRFNYGKAGNLKPLIKVAGKPILQRIIEFFILNGINDIILLGGYKFNELELFAKKYKKVNIKAINTGLNTDTGGRLFKVKNLIGDEDFFLTYGDSLINHNLQNIVSKKKNNKNTFYVCSYSFPFQYGVFETKNNKILKINKKKIQLQINSGFYLLDKRIFNFFKSKNESFEKDLIKRLIKSNIDLEVIKIKYWKAMDTPADKLDLERIIKNTSFFNYNKKLTY